MSDEGSKYILVSVTSRNAMLDYIAELEKEIEKLENIRFQCTECGTVHKLDDLRPDNSVMLEGVAFYCKYCGKYADHDHMFYATKVCQSETGEIKK